MCKILLSINPEHVENIMSGEKLYEFRKIKCKEKVDKILIYSTSPVMKVVGEVDVVDVIVNSPELVWNVTAKHSGITKNFFDAYFQNRDRAVAYKLGKIKKYKEPKDLSYYGISNAPQSFVYV
jgi:predicted transcriptional regulator